MISAFVDEAFKENQEQIEAKKHDFNFSLMLSELRGKHPWADGGVVLATVTKKKLELLGDPPADDGTRKKKNKMTTEDKKKSKEEVKKEDEEPTIDISQLIGRDVDVGNSAEVLAIHRAVTGGKI